MKEVNKVEFKVYEIAPGQLLKIIVRSYIFVIFLFDREWDSNICREYNASILIGEPTHVSYTKKLRYIWIIWGV